MCLAFLAIASLAVQAQHRFSLADTVTALPKDVVPTRAALFLDLDPQLDAFTGRVEYTLRLASATPAIVIHAAPELQLRGTELRGPRGPVAVARQPSDIRETWRFARADGRPLSEGIYSLALDYRGVVSVAAQGLYRVNYTISGQPARMLATHMEPIHARRLLPAFDEPVFRVPYEVSVRAPAGDEVLSNMPLAATTAEEDRVRHRFPPTPPMPVYLLAVAVGRFDVLADEADGIPLRIFTAPGKREQARRAMEATKELLPYLQRYFGRPYELPKLDQLAVPGVRRGGMEDWGLISYIENGLLFDSATTSEAEWVTRYGLIAHELAHQWFGNLVSPASWNEIWLNEAFATWMARRAMEHFHPQWQIPVRRRTLMAEAMEEDGLGTSRPVRGGFVSEDRVDDVFDNITYWKGSSVVAMIEQWVGPEQFQLGIRRYMGERALKPATAGDLWHHVGRAAKAPVERMAATWTEQRGIPLVDVDAHCDGDATAVTLRQARYSALDALPPQTWSIPVALAIGKQRHTVLLDTDVATYRVPGCSDEPVLANAGAAGYYRVDYSVALRQRLLDGYDRLSAADQIAVSSDSMSMAWAGRKPLADHIGLWKRLQGLDGEPRIEALLLAHAQFRDLDLAFHGLPAQAALHAAARALFAADLRRLGWQPAAGESASASRLRNLLIVALARYGDADVRKVAQERFAAALAGDSGVAGSVRGSILAAGAAAGASIEFDALLEALRAAASQQQRFLLVNALAAVPGMSFTQRMLDEALSGRLPTDVSMLILRAAGADPASGAAAYRFAVENWDPFRRLAGDWLPGLLPAAASWAADEAQARRLREDSQRLVGAAGAAKAEQAAAAIVARARLRDREAERLLPALQALSSR
jgi:aminopeptidase N